MREDELQTHGQRFVRRNSKLIAELLRFGVSTGLSAAISFGLPILLHELLRVPEQLAVAIGLVLALMVNFLMLRLVVFASHHPWTQDLWRYATANGTFRAAEYVVFLILMDFARLDYILALVIVLTVSTLIKFVAYRFLFRR